MHRSVIHDIILYYFNKKNNKACFNKCAENTECPVLITWTILQMEMDSSFKKTEGEDKTPLVREIKSPLTDPYSVFLKVTIHCHL